MSVNNSNEPMLEVYLFETDQMLEQLETLIISSEKSQTFDEDAINEIFRCTHTIKGSSAMMVFDNIATVAHTMEDLFYFIREKKPSHLDFLKLSDLMLEGIDFIKVELVKIKNHDNPNGQGEPLVEAFKQFLEKLKLDEPGSEEIVKPASKKKQQYYIPKEKRVEDPQTNSYKGVIHFEEGCEMENIRAYTVVFGLAGMSSQVTYNPSDILEDDETCEWIKENGFEIFIQTDLSYDEIHEHLSKTVFLRRLELEKLDADFVFEEVEPQIQKVTEPSPIKVPVIVPAQDKNTEQPTAQVSGAKDTPTTAAAAVSMISVHVEKLDKLMNLVGELVVADAMVTQNPIIEQLEIENFQKATRQLHKITTELQDMVMSIRMVPLSTTFVKMHRIVRDMSKKLDKEVELELHGEETEVDKNIIEHISDPLMHLIRNAVDHGIEDLDTREAAGKPDKATIILEARHSGGDVLISVKDDGKGLSREKIIEKAQANGLLMKSENEMTDREVFNLILLPGFSTKESVTEFSGRGVGMDVVSKNIEAVGGSIIVESIEGKETSITMKIPLTLAIVEGMNVKVGRSRYTIPIMSIVESFKPEIDDCVQDPDNNELVMVRGECYPIIRLHERYHVADAQTELSEGILLMVEQDHKTVCLFADELLGQQQVVVKSLPSYIQNIRKIQGISGCALLGDGNISLIVDVAGFTGLVTG